MKILAPVNSLPSCKAQIAAGANEIYIGLQSDIYKLYSFSARPQKNNNEKFIVPDKKELASIVKYCHDNNSVVNLTANISYFSDFCEKIDIEKAYIKHIYEAIDCGVDNIIIGDIGLIYILSTMKLPVQLHASTYFDTITIDQLLFLKELGISRTVLSYHVSFDEIQKLCAAKIMEIEIFCYLSCSFYDGCCYFSHVNGISTIDPEIRIGIPCRSKYNIHNSQINEKNINFFDASLNCALCSLYKLNKAGVDVLKIVGRELEFTSVEQATKLFSAGVKIAQEASDNLEYEQKIKEIRYPWWERIFCHSKRCKYRENIVTNSYVGIS